jgi:hypothetical protein
VYHSIGTGVPSSTSITGGTKDLSYPSAMSQGDVFDLQCLGTDGTTGSQGPD